MRGKNKCKILKQIRQKIADENDIPFVTQECTFQGECKGTCPRCEAELRYLEQQLEKRQKLGKTVTVAALAASLMAGLTACPSNREPKTPDKVEGTFFAQATEPGNEEFDGTPLPESSENAKVGEIEFEGEPTESCEIIGEVEATEDLPELEGDIAYIDPNDLDPSEIGGLILPDDSEIDKYFEGYHENTDFEDMILSMIPVSETEEPEDDSEPIDIYESEPDE